jgi:hypothetical protein
MTAEMYKGTRKFGIIRGVATTPSLCYKIHNKVLSDRIQQTKLCKQHLVGKKMHIICDIFDLYNEAIKKTLGIWQ